MNLEKLFNDIEALAISNPLAIGGSPQETVYCPELSHVSNKLLEHAKNRTVDTVNEVVRAHFKLAKRLQGAATLVEVSSHTPRIRAVKLGPLRITMTKEPVTDYVVISWRAGDVIKSATVAAKFELHEVDANDVLYAMHTPMLWLPDQPADIEEVPTEESSTDSPVSDNVEGVVVEWITNGVLVRGGSSEGTFCNYYESLETFVRDRLGAQAGRYTKHVNPKVGDKCILYFDLHDAADS